MNKKKFGYIYITTNLINGKKYIGQHAFPTFDKKYKGSGTSLKKAFEKYGKENFSVEVIEWCYSQEELNEREVYWLKEYNAIESKEFYNLTLGNGQFIRGTKLSEETKRKISASNKGQKRTELTRKRISNALKGREFSEETLIKMKKSKQNISEETREKISNSRKGLKYSKIARKNISNGHKGLKHSELTKKKIAESKIGEKNPNFGKHLSEETKKKMSERKKGENNIFYGKHHSEGTKQKMKEAWEKRRESVIGTVWINNGEIQKRVKPEEQVIYLSNGFVKGKIKKVKVSR